MKKILLMTAIAAMGLGGCDKRPEPLKIDNALTAEEIAAGRLTPEVMWKICLHKDTTFIQNDNAEKA